ncbi:aldo/keto reductase [Spirosoma sordidisoli]|uniref:aldo/keto reductase n=1 Tax=Spirosoma sordidisoli TaxID=2502893 RepID=UPI0019D19C60|nr:aldo/keto reductase [Spirosoma sordidisoli]
MAGCATKFGFNTPPRIPRAGSNGRKHIHHALENFLRRLKTDYVDLYWLHVWDMVIPVEEVLHTLGALVQAGKIRYISFSDMPACYTAQAAILAAVHQIPGPIADGVLAGGAGAHSCRSQMRTESVALESAGFLAGRYQQSNEGADRQGRLGGSPLSW